MFLFLQKTELKHVFKFSFLNVTKNVLLRVYFAHEYVFGLKITSGSIRVYLNIFDAATKYVHSDEILFCRQIRPAEMEVSEGCFEHNVQHSCAGEA